MVCAEAREALLVLGLCRHARPSQPRGVILVALYLMVKGAEDVLYKPYVAELSMCSDTMYFIVDSGKEKEDWINFIV